MSNENLTIYGITTMKNGKNFWTRVGKAFVNRDGSINLLFNFVPTDPNTRLQLRRDEREESPAAGGAGEVPDMPEHGIPAHPFA